MKSIIVLSALFCLISAATAQKPVSNDVIIIPVVVHVVYNTEQQNISREQINSQINVLNEDYRKKNRNITYIPEPFRPLAADAQLEFRFATVDPSGLPTEGIVRKNTAVGIFGINDHIKSSLTGGSDTWDRNKYLNIWIGNLDAGLMGYASSPGCSPERDGVVISYRAFGTTGQARSPFNGGRTAVHEIGHWLGLKHIWGEGSCGDDDIDDTPPQQGPTRGCPMGIMATSCSGGAAGNMYMNFMDFTNDNCTSMFTHGQVSKMRQLFGEGEARHSLRYSDRAAGAVADSSSERATGLFVSLYPNPASSQVHVTIPGHAHIRNKYIIIYNHLGQVMRRVPVANKTTTIDIADLRYGLYFVSAGGDKKSAKFIKGL